MLMVQKCRMNLFMLHGFTLTTFIGFLKIVKSGHAPCVCFALRNSCVPYDRPGSQEKGTRQKRLQQ